jgi:hypothetical protein
MVDPCGEHYTNCPLLEPGDIVHAPTVKRATLFDGVVDTFATEAELNGYMHPGAAGPASLAIIERANVIIADYAAQGFDLTLRQLYYQFVARGIIPNRDTEYKRLGSIINDARLAGLIDWNSIQDRTRELRKNPHWMSPAGVIESALNSYHLDLWKGQGNRPEVWIEKDALVGVIAGVCNALDVPYFSCRGYTSQSEMWAAGQRLRGYRQAGQRPVILHLGDHDPSGIDMTRDIFERLEMFTGNVPVVRLALNMPQVLEYNPPPNPAKLTDSRIAGYLDAYGAESWELDALEPSVLVALVREAITGLIDQDPWDEREALLEEHKTLLRATSERWDEVAAFVAS